MTKEQKKKWLKAIEVQIAWYESTESIDPYDGRILCHPRNTPDIGICETAEYQYSEPRKYAHKCFGCLWEIFESEGGCSMRLEIENTREKRIHRLKRWREILHTERMEDE